jgi:hypothetical protein
MSRNKAAKDRASTQFEREKHLTERLMQRLGWPVPHYHNPNVPAGMETGADVLIVHDGARTGIQVTEIDTGSIPGRDRAKEKKDLRDSGLTTYGGLALNNRNELLGRIQRAIAHKVEIAERHSFNAFEKIWLLVSAGVPEMGSVISTMIITLGLDAAALDAVTLDCLVRSKYDRVYIHCILGVERALYSWQRGGNWEKDVQQEPACVKGPSFWDIQKVMRSMR